jgi:hypothetical protein
VPSTDTYVSVDIEADGRIPGESSLLSLGAVAVDQPGETFYAELKPISERFLPEALAVSGLDRDRLVAEGLDPAEAMARFCAWVGGLGGHPVFVSFSSWDWVFVYYYLIRFAGRSPFGHSSLDLKSYYAGRFGIDFRATAKRRCRFRLKVDSSAVPVKRWHSRLRALACLRERYAALMTRRRSRSVFARP